VISSLVHSVLPFIVLLVAAYFVVGPLPATAALYPFAVLVMIPMLLGLGWAIAALGAYVRDLGQVITLAVTVFMFLSPIFVPVGKFPAWAQPLVRLNPVTVPIELCNAALFGTPAPGIETVLTYTVCSVAVCVIGWKIFAICRSGFADVV
jgi:lipopolysaccharide transport system permease protein